MIASIIAVNPHPMWILPFAMILLSIATMPLFNKHWWEHHYPKLSVGLGAIVVLYYIWGLHALPRVQHTLIEYVSFICLLGSLFVVSGGIHIMVKGEARPFANVIFLMIGAMLANIIGTTGASMLLIRPWIRMNKYRITQYHMVFFIFIVSNCAGCLTPVGDPPLFLGYLKGIPFFWTLTHLWGAWLFVNGLLLAVFYVIDRRNFHRASQSVREKETHEERWNFLGLHNLGFLALILGSVFIKEPVFLREAVMVIAALGSYFTTSKDVHNSNDFNFEPIKEVAWLFLGIFATMMPALDYLQHNADHMGFRSAMNFYWAAGILSSILDNAPTYLTFLTADMGLHHRSINSVADVLTHLSEFPLEVMAVSLGSVFYGAMTYIGNGPNFMVKTVAEQAKLHTPSFFGYIFKYSLPILLPILALAGWIWFR